MTTIKNLMEELKHEMNETTRDFISNYSLDSSSYICDAISQFADSMIDIYYNDLFEWCKHNFDYVNQAIAEFGSSNDIIRDIQSGQYLQYTEELYQDIEEAIKYLVLEYLDENYSNIEIEKLEEILDTIDTDHNNRFNDLIDTINEILEELEAEEE